MTRKVGIAELKAKLSEHLATVRQGHTVTVLDRGRPIARIVPHGPNGYEPLEVRKATRSVRDLTLPPPPGAPTDSLAILLQDRQR